MDRSLRIFIFLLLVSLGIGSLFIAPNVVRAQSEESEGSFLGHIVQPGEDINTIAAHFGTTSAAIAEANRISETTPLVPGQLLRIRAWDEQLPATDPAAAEPSAPAENPEPEPPVLTGEKWIDVDLSEQTLTAYQGETVVMSFSISSGLPAHPTVTGTFQIWAKVASQTMTGGSRAAGDYYNLPGVPWVQYFYEDYSIHGTYWHNNFGHPMSHGCVNMRTEDAQWLFDWAAPTMDAATVESAGWLIPTEGGTRVEVHD
jgi:lipoprotein-anchoring transpeptidase ErfK/SrfK